MMYVWSWFVRATHWLLVAAFTSAFLNSQSIWDMNNHVLAGYTAGGLMIARILWGLTAKGYCNFSQFPFRPLEGLRYVRAALTGKAKRYMGHNPAGSLAIYGMLAVGLLTVATGLLVLNDGYLPVAPGLLQTVHGALAWTWLALVVMHVGGVLMESLLHRENLIATMVTGFKRRHSERSLKPEEAVRS